MLQTTGAIANYPSETLLSKEQHVTSRHHDLPGVCTQDVLLGQANMQALPLIVVKQPDEHFITLLWENRNRRIKLLLEPTGLHHLPLQTRNKPNCPLHKTYCWVNEDMLRPKNRS